METVEELPVTDEFSQPKKKIEWEDLDKPKFFFYGTTLFMGVRFVLYPPFVIKTRLQTQAVGNSSAYTGTAHAFKSIVRTEGIRGLYKGFWISSINLAFRQVYFAVFEVLRAKLGPGSALYQVLGPTGGELARNLISGAGCSAAFQVFTIPVDVVSQRMMVAGKGDANMRPKASVLARQIYEKHGIRGFYKGVGASLMQFAPTSAIWWTTYHAVELHVERVSRPLFSNKDNAARVSQAIAGFTGGTVAVLLTNPLDVIRTRLQVLGTENSTANRTFVTEFQHLLATEGAKSLTKGLVPRLIAVAPASVIIISVYEFIKRVSVKDGC